MTTDFTMPSLGADMESGRILEWLVKPGDQVKRGEPMAVIDTDKAAVEIESFQTGIVGELLVEPGQQVAVGTRLATLLIADDERGTTSRSRRGPKKGARGKAAASHPAAAKAAPGIPAQAPVPNVPAADAARPGTPTPPPPIRHHAAELGVDLSMVTGTGTGGRVTRHDIDVAARRRRVSPYARRLAAELGVDLARVSGTGTGGTVRADDVRTAADAVRTGESRTTLPTVGSTTGPSPAPATAPRSERATIAALMSRSKREIPHYYVATTVDMHTVVTWIRDTNRTRPVTERIVPAAALLRAVALAARTMPQLNGFWLDDAFVPGEDVHLGVAISVRHGALVAPALHGAADLELPALMLRLRDLVTRARSGRLTRAELTDPTLTVTDLGDQGVEEVIGVIQPPQVALVGIGRMADRPWAVDGLLGVRPLVRFSLSGDHRATDGYTGARFLATIDDLLQHPEAL
jgi:pyruvate dehydrogenase E2 component (dihydrolipoamide acetyltransferase)